MNHVIAPSKTSVTEEYAHFAATLEETLKEELSPEIFASSLEESCAAFELPNANNVQKNPEVMKMLVRIAAGKGKTSATLEAIIRNIWKTLKNVDLP